MVTKCLIVDDEPLAIEIIDTYLSKFPEIEIAGKCDNALEAFEVIRKTKIDLMFLDIQMPQITGVEFVKSLTNPPKVIFTTAYRDYACEGFDLNAVDYLLKPISFERFLKAINKYYENRTIKNEVTQSDEKPNEITDHIYIKVDKKNIKVLYGEILYIESMKDYVVFKLKDKKLITKNRISHYEEYLPTSRFLRCHRSFIIVLDKVTAYTPLFIEIADKKIPIGRNYKNMVCSALEGKIKVSVEGKN